MADDFTNLAPQSTREWLQFISNKQDTLMESQAEDREVMVKYMDKIDEWIACHDKADGKQVEKVSQLEKKVDAIKIGEWVTMVVAAIAAFFGMGGR